MKKLIVLLCMFLFISKCFSSNLETVSPDATGNWNFLNVVTSTMTVNIIFTLTAIDYLPTEVSTGTICNYWNGTNYEIRIATGIGITGGSSTDVLWGKFSIFTP